MERSSGCAGNLIYSVYKDGPQELGNCKKSALACLSERWMSWMARQEGEVQGFFRLFNAFQGCFACILSQELDYGTNFLADGEGQWKDSGLGEAFRAGLANPDIISVIDWKPYGCLGGPET